MYPSKNLYFPEWSLYGVPFFKCISRSQNRKVESSTTYLHAQVDDTGFFRESNMLRLSSVRAANSSQQVNVGGSKSFQTNLNAAMTNSVLRENLFEA